MPETPRNASHILDLLQKEIDQKHTAIRNHATLTASIAEDLSKCQETSIRLMEIIAKEGDRELTDKELFILGNIIPQVVNS